MRAHLSGCGFLQPFPRAPFPDLDIQLFIAEHFVNCLCWLHATNQAFIQSPPSPRPPSSSRPFLRAPARAQCAKTPRYTPRLRDETCSLENLST